MAERLGDRIRRVRKERALGLRETADKIGISPTYLSRIETMEEKSPPAERVLKKLADLLEDDFDALMQLAGRVPEDLEKVITSNPAMPEVLRQVREKNVSARDLLAWLEKQKKGRSQ